MATPTAIFPGAIATAAQLKVANNLIQSKLRVAVDAVNTILFVDSAAGFGPNMLVSIDKEIVAISGVQTSPNAALLVAAGGRGFDGTAAAPHAAGAKVSVLIDAWHHNVLSAEITAIQTALGPNLSNVGRPVDLISSDYDFAALTPGGALSPGSNTITLTPVPKGVNGSDAHHYLYISGGTGTAEAVLITGGTAVSGAASGTVIVTCANAHSGAWTIKSATVGIQEAVQIFQTAATGGRVLIPAGGFGIFAGVYVAHSGISIYGRGMQGGTALFQGTPNVTTFTFDSTEGNGIFDLQIIDSSGGSTISWGIQALGLNVFSAERISINGTSNGIFVGSNTYSTFRDIKITGHTVDGIVIRGLVDDVEMFDNVSVLGGSTGVCLRILQAGSVIFAHCNFMGCLYGAIIGASALPVFSIDFVNCYFDHNVTAGVSLAPGPGGSITRVRFVQCWMATSTIGVGIDTTNAAPNDVLLDQCIIADNSSGGVIIGAGALNVKVRGCDIFKNGTASGISVGNNVDGITITDNTIGNDASWGGNTQAFGVFFASAVSRLMMSGNIFKLNASSHLSAVPALTSSAIGPNAGIDDVAQTIASAASITLGWNPVVKITGTTTITTITGGWAGRTITLIFTNASPSGVGTGGNISRTLPAAQNQAVRLTFDGTSWF
jgi:hypothetical protein